jgi:hypothetical protein
VRAGSGGGRSKLCRGPVGKLDVDQSPLSGLLIVLAATIPIRVAIPVNPGGLAADVVGGQIVGVSGKYRRDFLADGRIEKPISAQGNNLVSLITPANADRGIRATELASSTSATTHCRAVEAVPPLFDNLVGAREQRLRNREAERLGGFEIDD